MSSRHIADFEDAIAMLRVRTHLKFGIHLQYIDRGGWAIVRSDQNHILSDDRYETFSLAFKALLDEVLPLEDEE